ncbi:glycosyltransferase family 2 protein [Leeuwenhoekiella polynyae]|uniref:GT2 family glycosyltransferase n=1 Tax=Leeuwenhoekiella polynyae TaxID=1550906 RepID=A0A4Q0PFI3_9FLAO|nr:glycosyltransferase [Leeuwenhoekiella polynyae]RXG25613.1 GT2 family glycosyltransferase [Leeuwenhoekiella polynyae]
MFKISILIPTFKRPVLVLEAIASCLDQTYLPFEIIISDDSPDDRTAQAVEELKRGTRISIIYLHNKPGLGQIGNTNRLFETALGDLILLLHDDDALLPIALDSLVKLFAADPDLDIAFGKQYIMTETGEVSLSRSEYFNTSYFRSAAYEGTVLTSLEAGMGQQFPNNGYLMKREIVEAIQFRAYGFDAELGNGCEYDFGLRIGIAGYKMYFLNQYLVKYRVALNSMSSSLTDDSGYQSFRILRNFIADTRFGEAIRHQRLRERAPIAITQAVNTGRRKDAFTIFCSEWYRSKILTIPGLKRLGYMCLAKSKL